MDDGEVTWPVMDSSRTIPMQTGELLERSRELSAVRAWLDEIGTTSSGRCVLVAGEAGVGKTALLREICAGAGERTRILWGACDSLFTPQPLGPLLDISEATGAEVAELVAAAGTPHAIATALLSELTGSRETILVFEDLHWADEATLDVLRLLARRIGNVPALLLASYRDDSLPRIHPLRVVLGELATAERVGRLVVAPLSPGAVAELAAPHGVDPDRLHRTTGGNAFFVTEVLATAEDEMPATVRDAVLARTARLAPGARQLLDAAAVIPPPVDVDLLTAMEPGASDYLDECLGAGMLTTAPGGVAFRHELARLALDQELPPGMKRDLHRRALAVLSETPTDAARLAHHAEGTGDAAAVLRIAPQAAVEAAKAGAHREAAAQYERALRFADGAPPELRAELLDARALESALVGEFSEAIAVGQEALECWRVVGDRRKEGRALAMIAWPLLTLGRTNDAEVAARQAVAILEELAPGPELTSAYTRLAMTLWGSAHIDEAIECGERALAVAERLGDRAAAVNALVTIATGNLWRPVPGARTELEMTLELARREGFEMAAGYAYVHLVGYALYEGRYTLAGSYLPAAIDYCNQHDLDSYAPHLVAMGGEVAVAAGRWDEAAAAADMVLARHGAGPATQSARLTLGLLRARRGDPGVWEPLDLALAQAESSGELWRMSLVAAARAEAAWLEGRPEAVVGETARAFDLGRSLEAPWALGRLGVWRMRADVHDLVAGIQEPFALQLSGDWTAAATRWRELGSPYEAALALADADDDDALREALGELQAMGAAPAAAIVARRLRSRGARRLPRGPRAQTRQNPANLTQRELEILGLLTEGLRNADIAQRLFLAPKTVAHHVSAILRKLGVQSRGEAAAAAMRLGLAPKGDSDR